MNKVTRDNLSAHRQEHNKQNSWWLNDIRGIPLCRICGDCETVAESTYKPEVLGLSGDYDDVVEEQVEPDDY
jgi:hypothetical protein